MIVMEFLKKIIAKESVLVIFLFTIFLSYALFLLQDLSFYMYGYDDFHLIYQTLHMSFQDFFMRIFFAPIEFYRGFLQLGIFQRVVQGLFLKATYAVAGLDPFFYHATRALFFAATGMLVYMLTKKITNNRLASIGAAAVYCALPVIYDGLRHIGAAEPFSQFFFILFIYLFTSFYGKDAVFKGKCMYALLVFLAALFAMKAREPEVIILPILGTFLLLQYKDWKKNAVWWFVLFVLSLYIVPLAFTHVSMNEEQEQDAIEITSEKILTNIKHLLFYNPETRTGNGEQTFVIFSPRQYLSETPGSLLGSIGFFLGWYFIAMICTFFYLLWKKKKGADEQHNDMLIPPSPTFTLVMLWFFFSILLMVLYVNPSDHSDIRYIGVMALPAIIVIVSFCYFITISIKKLDIQYVSKNILTIFLIILLLSAVVNASITGIHRRGGIGSRHVGMSMATETIFQDLYNQSFTPYFFFALTEISGEDEYIGCTLNTNITLDNVIVTNDPFFSITKAITEENIENALSNYGVVYIISYRTLLSEDTYSGLQFVAQINPCEEGYYCTLKNALKKQKMLAELFQEQFDYEPKYFIYKIVRDAPSFKEPIALFCSGQEGLHPNPALII
ncbi:MAG: hypothetical protein AABX82_03600 [Nanoarchaeota archaeon]